MKYDIILFENFHAAFHHKYDVHLIACLLKSQGKTVAILNAYDEDKPEDYPGIDLLNIPINESVPDDKSWLESKGNTVKRLHYTVVFLSQQRRYMKAVRRFVEDKADSFYLGSYHLLMPSVFFSLNKPCYYWGLRSYRMTGFWQIFKSNPFLAFRMIYLKKLFLKNEYQKLFVSNEIIKNEFIQIGVPEKRLVIREERCIKDIKDFSPEVKDEEFSLLVIGGLRKQKHIETTIRAFKDASLKNSLLRLVGENKDEIYETIIEDEIGDCQSIERINKRLEYEDFLGYMTRSHFTLFADEKGKSSITNGTMMESIISYTPIIAPNYNPFAYYIDKYGIGLSFRPGDVNSYSETIKKAKEMGYECFIDKIKIFQKTLEFNNIARQLYIAINQ